MCEHVSKLYLTTTFAAHAASPRERHPHGRSLKLLCRPTMRWRSTICVALRQGEPGTRTMSPCTKVCGRLRDQTTRHTTPWTRRAWWPACSADPSLGTCMSAQPTVLSHAIQLCSRPPAWYYYVLGARIVSQVTMFLSRRSSFLQSPHGRLRGPACQRR